MRPSAGDVPRGGVRWLYVGMSDGNVVRARSLLRSRTSLEPDRWIVNHNPQRPVPLLLLLLLAPHADAQALPPRTLRQVPHLPLLEKNFASPSSVSNMNPSKSPKRSKLFPPDPGGVDGLEHLVDEEAFPITCVSSGMSTDSAKSLL
jgi:hypothetical protein